MRTLRVVDELDKVISGFETADCSDRGNLEKQTGRDLITAFTAFDKKLEKMVRDYLKKIGRD